MDLIFVCFVVCIQPKKIRGFTFCVEPHEASALPHDGKEPPSLKSFQVQNKIAVLGAGCLRYYLSREKRV